MGIVLTEPELFDWLKEFYYPDLKMSDDPFSKYDCISEKRFSYIELKSRHTHYDDLLIEKIKYDALMQTANQRFLTPVYINSTPEGVWEFDLNFANNIKWESRQMPATTEFDNNDKIDKVVGYLHIKDGVKL